VKILLIYPYCLEGRPHTDDADVVPIGLYYVGALLKENDYDVEILNWHDIHKTPERISKAITKKKPDVIGFSILHANRWGGIEIARIAKAICSKVKIVFGGIGASFLWEHFLRHFAEIDFIITGEGEYSFLNLVRCIEQEKDKDIWKISGIAFRKQGDIIRTADAPLTLDLDKLPNPAKYFDYQYVSSTRGCPGNCTFCGSPRFWGHKVRFHSPDYFVEQLELLSSKGIRFFYFSDDTFTIKKIHAIEICKRILERGLGITWMAISRVNTVDEEILYWMRRAGCIQISYGVESGSETIRNLLCKNIKTGQIKKSFELTVRYGILARAYFIYGSPGENWTTIKETMDLIHEIKPLSIIFYILDIFPGTALYSDFKKRSEVTDDIWLNRIEDIMYFEIDTNLSQELILAFGERLRADYYDHLADFVNEIKLINKEEFYPMHADFLSRLAMTFTHGDYVRIEEIKGKEHIAEKLYKKALTYHPDFRAYLGLGIIAQKNGAYEASAEILSKGIANFPDSEPLNICLGISYMNLGEYAKALSFFLKFPDSRQVPDYMAQCYHALGEFEKETAILKQLGSR